MITYENLQENRFCPLKDLDLGDTFIHKIDFDDQLELEAFIKISKAHDINNILSLKTGYSTKTDETIFVLPVDIKVIYKV